MSFGDIVKDFLADKSIGSLLKINNEYYILITYKELEILKQITKVEYTEGSVLLLGNSHEIGGITVIKEYKHLGGYIISAEFEGNEYLSGKEPSKQKEKALIEINNRLVVRKDNFDFSLINCSKIDLNSKQPPFLIIPDKKFVIINKYCTKEFLEEIIEYDQKL